MARSSKSRLKRRRPTKKRRSPARKAPVARARRRYRARKTNPIGTQHTKEVGTVVAIAAGGALAGLVEGMQDRQQLPDLPMDLEPGLVIGAALVAVPVALKMKGRNATIAALLGTGMLAAAAKEYVSNIYAPAGVALDVADSMEIG